MKKYDIFISYRRDLGAETAKHLRDVLHAKGYRVFFDTDTLSSGDFNKELLRVIEECNDFIIILSPGALDRCVNEDDWVRQELACALRTNKNIIPVMHSKFSFPEVLPEDIDNIRWKNGVPVNVQFFDAVVDKITSFLTKKPRNILIERRLLPVFLILFVIALAVIGIRYYISLSYMKGIFPSNAYEDELLNDCVDYSMQNLGTANLAFEYYDRVLSDAMAYCDGKATAPSKDELLDDILYYSEETGKLKEELVDLDEGLSSELEGIEQLQESDMRDLYSLLCGSFDVNVNNLNSLYWMINDSSYSNAELARIIEILQEYSAESKEYYYIILNEIFAAVDEEALIDLKKTYLPSLTSIYQTGYTWNTDRDTLESYEYVLVEKMNNTLDRYDSLVVDEE